jgi:hypothetical protein
LARNKDYARQDGGLIHSREQHVAHAIAIDVAKLDEFRQTFGAQNNAVRDAASHSDPRAREALRTIPIDDQRIPASAASEVSQSPATLVQNRVSHTLPAR